MGIKKGRGTGNGRGIGLGREWTDDRHPEFPKSTEIV